MKIIKQQIFLTIVSLVSILIGLYFSLAVKPDLKVTNIITMAYFKWPLLLISGILLMTRKIWALIFYIIAGLIYIIYDITLLTILIFMAIFMNDSNVSNKDLTKLFFIYISGIIPFVFYWITSIVYLINPKVKVLFK